MGGAEVEHWWKILGQWEGDWRSFVGEGWMKRGGRRQLLRDFVLCFQEGLTGGAILGTTGAWLVNERSSGGRKWNGNGVGREWHSCMWAIAMCASTSFLCA
jgi:hypothetical protein